MEVIYADPLSRNTNIKSFVSIYLKKN